MYLVGHTPRISTPIISTAQNGNRTGRWLSGCLHVFVSDVLGFNHLQSLKAPVNALCKNFSCQIDLCAIFRERMLRTTGANVAHVAGSLQYWLLEKHGRKKSCDDPDGKSSFHLTWLLFTTQWRILIYLYLSVLFLLIVCKHVFNV